MKKPKKPLKESKVQTFLRKMVIDLLSRGIIASHVILPGERKQKK